MSAIDLDDLTWFVTFPHRVAPLPDVWLPGLLLRCDEVYHWESGEAFRQLLRATKHQRLAQLLKIPLEHLRGTTYDAELRQLYGNKPHPRLLLGLHYYPDNLSWGRKIRKREITIERKIHLCPECIAQTRTICRSVTLAHLQHFPIHRNAFQGHCVCGSPLLFFFRGRSPFTGYSYSLMHSHRR